MYDYIRRDTVLKKAKSFTSIFSTPLIIRAIEEEPAEDVVEVKHGKWLKTDAYPHRIYCSLCYKTYVTNEEIIKGRSDRHPTYCREAKYCPHCGAKMDLKEGKE